MTDETIQSILDTLNSGRTSEVIVRQIGRNVWWGFAWGPSPFGYHGFVETKGHEMFFIKVPQGGFAAAILWHGCNEMHWYVAKKHRRQRVLVKLLKAVILPFIFERHGEKEQSCSVEFGIEHASASMKLAKQAGFRAIDRDDKKVSYEISRKNVPPYKPWPCKKPALSELEQIGTEAKVAMRSLRMAIDNLRVNFTDHIKSEKLENLHFESEITVETQIMDCVEDAKWLLKSKL